MIILNVVKTKQRIVYWDLLKIIACFCVIVNHTNSFIFNSTQPSLLWFISVIYYLISKIAVPIFILVTGCTLLNKTDTYKKALHRFMKIILVIVLFSFMFYIVDIFIFDLGDFNLIDFLVKLVREPYTGSYWYLYTYAGIVLMMPILQKVVKALNKKDLIFYIVISLIFFGIYPMLVKYFPDVMITSYFELPLINMYVCLLFIGYYIGNYVKCDKKLMIIAIALFFCSIGVNTILIYNEYLIDAHGYYVFFDNKFIVTTIIASVSVFYIVKCISISDIISKYINKIGKYTFGIYLLSDFFILHLYKLQVFLMNHFYAIFAILLFEIIVFICGMIGVFIIKKIPYLKKII